MLSGQFRGRQFYNSTSFDANKNWFSDFVPNIKRTGGIRKKGKFWGCCKLGTKLVMTRCSAPQHLILSAIMTCYGYISIIYLDSILHVYYFGFVKTFDCF